MLWIFNKEKRQTRQLIKLFRKTISRVDQLLVQSSNQEERELITKHRNSLHYQLDYLEKFFEGKLDDLEIKLWHPLFDADNTRQSLKTELQEFTGSASELAKYARAIHSL